MKRTRIDLDLGFVAAMAVLASLAFKTEIACALDVESACAALEKKYEDINKD